MKLSKSSPFYKKTFFLDLKGYPPEAERQLAKDIKLLGGKEAVFSKDISFVISNRIPPKPQHWIPATSMTNSPTPSPPMFSDCPIDYVNSPERCNSPTGDKMPCSMGQSRGLFLLQKAHQKKQGGTTDILEVCNKYGIKVHHVDKALSCIKKLKNLFYGKNQDSTQEKTKEKKINKSSSDVMKIRAPFIKVEDNDRMFKTRYKILSSWVDIVDPALSLLVKELQMNFLKSGTVEFDTIFRLPLKEMNVNSLQRNSGSGGQFLIPPTPSNTKSFTKLSSTVLASNANSVISTEMKKIPDAALHQDKQHKHRRRKIRQYCEMCCVHFNCLNEHVESDSHVKYMSESSNFVEIEKIILDLPKLQDIITVSQSCLKSNSLEQRFELNNPVISSQDKIFQSVLQPLGVVCREKDDLILFSNESLDFATELYSFDDNYVSASCSTASTGLYFLESTLDHNRGEDSEMKANCNVTSDNLNDSTCIPMDFRVKVISKDSVVDKGEKINPFASESQHNMCTYDSIIDGQDNSIIKNYSVVKHPIHYENTNLSEEKEFIPSFSNLNICTNLQIIVDSTISDTKISPIDTYSLHSSTVNSLNHSEPAHLLEKSEEQILNDEIKSESLNELRKSMSESFQNTIFQPNDSGNVNISLKRKSNENLEYYRAKRNFREDISNWISEISINEVSQDSGVCSQTLSPVVCDEGVSLDTKFEQNTVHFPITSTELHYPLNLSTKEDLNIEGFTFNTGLVPNPFIGAVDSSSTCTLKNSQIIKTDDKNQISSKTEMDSLLGNCSVIPVLDDKCSNFSRINNVSELCESLSCELNSPGESTDNSGSLKNSHNVSNDSIKDFAQVNGNRDFCCNCLTTCGIQTSKSCQINLYENCVCCKFSYVSKKQNCEDLASQIEDRNIFKKSCHSDFIFVPIQMQNCSKISSYLEEETFNNNEKDSRLSSQIKNCKTYKFHKVLIYRNDYISSFGKMSIKTISLPDYCFENWLSNSSQMYLSYSMKNVGEIFVAQNRKQPFVNIIINFNNIDLILEKNNDFKFENDLNELQAIKSIIILESNGKNLISELVIQCLKKYLNHHSQRFCLRSRKVIKEFTKQISCWNKILKYDSKIKTIPSLAFENSYIINTNNGISSYKLCKDAHTNLMKHDHVCVIRNCCLKFKSTLNEVSYLSTKVVQPIDLSTTSKQSEPTTSSSSILRNPNSPVSTLLMLNNSLLPNNTISSQNTNVVNVLSHEPGNPIIGESSMLDTNTLKNSHCKPPICKCRRGENYSQSSELSLRSDDEFIAIEEDTSSGEEDWACVYNEVQTKCTNPYSEEF